MTKNQAEEIVSEARMMGVEARVWPISGEYGVKFTKAVNVPGQACAGSQWLHAPNARYALQVLDPQCDRLGAKT